MNLASRFTRKIATARCNCRLLSQNPKPLTKNEAEKESPWLIRNIGIFAHIDAGKTTTTERMLFFSGAIKNMGEVHHGNTVTDFMEQERERGITITAAAVTFPWDKCKINLLDTPGHIDFTMEVEQTLSVMDGAVVVLDGSAGVEAQTVTVWNQADRFKIPRIIYVNKMDKHNAAFLYSVKSVKAKLCDTPVVLQLPYFDEGFKGVVDVLTLEKFEWDLQNQGMSFVKKQLTESDGKVWEDAIAARLKLTETLSDVDDHLTELIIVEEKSMENVPTARLRDSIRKSTLQHKVVPILCGSSYKNIGVQLLLDSVIHYLPPPVLSSSDAAFKCFGDTLCARAFKVRHDPLRGPIVFFRVYSGKFSKPQKIYNMRLKATEHCGTLMVANADDYEEVNEIRAGNIVAVSGLKETIAGDLVTVSASAMTAAKTQLLTLQKDKKLVENPFVVGTEIPEPVFFCSVEAPSLRFQSALDKALGELSREDPSLRVTRNDETGQVVLGGMGELHLEIIKDRIRSEYKVEADLGPLQIAYKEALIGSATDTSTYDHIVGKSRNFVKVMMTVEPCTNKEADILHLDKSPAYQDNINAIFPKHLVAVRRGVESALLCGPKLNCEVINARIILHYLEVGRGTTESMIISAVSQGVKKLFATAGTRLWEPVMWLEVVCSHEMMEKVVRDLSSKRAHIEKISAARNNEEVVYAEVPLSELLGYSTSLRILTSGRASLSMEFKSLREMRPEDEGKAIRSVTGMDPF